MQVRVVAAMGVWLGLAVVVTVGSSFAQSRPNILWLSSEDNGPALGAYGDTYADTPHLDRLAERGTFYRHAWSNAPVCAPARTAIITGVYPPATGSHHMRSRVRLPAGMAMFPQLLRADGYYTTNNAKEDYNLDQLGQVWDESSSEAHWRHRPAGAPFFAVFNFGATHESRIRQRPHVPLHDPAGVRIPAYHPDVPAVRQDWAQYYDRLTEMDARVGQHLAELESAGLAEDTIVMYFGDHGVGLPRGKRSLRNSGLRVPLIIYVPERFRALAGDGYRAGTATDELAAFVDLAPTTLSLAGIAPPDYMHGRALLGPHRGGPADYLYGFRDRMDERYDFVRGVRDARYLYVRNYAPYRIYGQFVWYMFQTPTTRVWRDLYEAGRLSPAQRAFWETKPPEELYDLRADPDEVRNLVGDPQHSSTLRRLRRALRRHLFAIRDLGFLPEPELHARTGDVAPYDFGRDDGRYPLALIFEVAELATRPDIPALPQLTAALSDGSTSVEVMAAEALGRFGSEDDLAAALRVLVARASLDDNDLFTSMLALNALDYLDRRAMNAVEAIAALPREQPGMQRQFDIYVPQLLDKILADLEP